MSSVRRAPFDLMVIVDPRVDGVLAALARLSDNVRGERVAVQLRAKGASETEVLALARDVAAVQPAMSRLILNGHVSVARAIAADGVHLPEASEAAETARTMLTAGALVGCSCHDEIGVTRRAREGADYVVLGPLGDVPGKPALGADAFAAIVRASTVPIVALGGIASERDADHATELGASAVAIERALLDPDAPTWLARWLERRIAA